MVNEKWKAIPGYEGYYDVSDLGRIRSCTRLVRHPYGGVAVKKGRILTKGRIWSGYETINLSREGVARRKSVHRIVCETFLGPPPSPRHQVCHINGKRDDNRAVNLRWGTAKENQEDKIRHGTLPTGYRNGKYTKPESTPRGEQHGNSKLSENQVRAIRKLHATYNISERLLAVVTGVSKSQVQNILRGRQWRHVL